MPSTKLLHSRKFKKMKKASIGNYPTEGTGIENSGLAKALASSARVGGFRIATHALNSRHSCSVIDDWTHDRRTVATLVGSPRIAVKMLVSNDRDFGIKESKLPFPRANITPRKDLRRQ